VALNHHIPDHSARFRCVFRNTDGYGVWKNSVSLG